MFDDDDPLLARVRAICMALPDAESSYRQTAGVRRVARLDADRPEPR